MEIKVEEWMTYNQIKSYCYISLGITCLQLHFMSLVTDQILGNKKALKVLKYHITMLLANSNKVLGNLKRYFKSLFALSKLESFMMVI